VYTRETTSVIWFRLFFFLRLFVNYIYDYFLTRARRCDDEIYYVAEMSRPVRRRRRIFIYVRRSVIVPPERCRPYEPRRRSSRNKSRVRMRARAVHTCIWRACVKNPWNVWLNIRIYTRGKKYVTFVKKNLFFIERDFIYIHWKRERERGRKR